MRRTATAMLLAIWAAGCGPAAGVKLSFSPAKPRFVLGEPVRLIFKAQNNTAKRVRLEIGNGKDDSVSFKPVRCSARNYRTFSPYFEGGGMSHVVEIDPGTSHSEEELLDKYVHFVAPGTFRVRCEARYMSLTANGRPVSAANVSTIKVVLERDPERLAEMIDEIARQLDGQGTRKRTLALVALSCSCQPRALKHLSRFIDDKDVALVNLALDGIFKIGNAEAKEILRQCAAARKGSYAGRRAAQLLAEMAKQEPAQ